MDSFPLPAAAVNVGNHERTKAPVFGVVNDDAEHDAIIRQPHTALSARNVGGVRVKAAKSSRTAKKARASDGLVVKINAFHAAAKANKAKKSSDALHATIAAKDAEIAELCAKLSVKDTEIETLKADFAAEVTRATNAADARATVAIADASALSKQTAAAAAKLVRRMQSKYAKKAMAARAREGALAGLSVAELKAQTLSVKAKTLSVVRSDIAEEAKFRAKVMDAMTPRLQRIIDMMPRTPDGAYVDPRSAPCVIDDAVNLFN